ncbi:hypothetical protein WA026_014815 [Henosepilachna vigintioctopunctata]|uniref:Phorbol-ester/DAG-type domain-containing protein n=1 Tax=Henosepilachna vigintioctopunctata TaxID=420089 RepID=A0AAW1UYR8_9CUCU
MAASEDEVELRLDKCGKKIEFKCAHCGKKVVDKVQCGKCLENFHPSCLGQAACRKDAICQGNVNVKDINNPKKLPTVVENKQTNILELDKNKEESNSMEVPWRKVVSRRIRTIGTAQTTANNEINTAFQGRNNGNKKVWLFLSRIKTGVTEEIIKTYLNEKLELSAQETPIVKKINTFHKMEDNECFQIGLDIKYRDQVYECTFWPSGVAFARFKFNYDNNQVNNSLANTNLQRELTNRQPN